MWTSWRRPKILVFVFISICDNYLGCSEPGSNEVGRPLVYTWGHWSSWKEKKETHSFKTRLNIQKSTWKIFNRCSWVAKTNLRFWVWNLGSSPRVEMSKENQRFYTLDLLLFKNSASGKDNPAAGLVICYRYLLDLEICQESYSSSYDTFIYQA